MINEKTSLLVPSQLPEFVGDNPDYANFNLFLKAYYEWMEQNNQVTERAKNILNYKDIDETTNEFIDYYKNEFLAYFPKDVLVDEKRAIKFAKELYQSKGTPASYQFLFRVLFNSDFDLFYTKDAVLRASDGTWYVAKSLKLNTEDTNFLNIKGYRLFGERTKSIATVETSVIAGTKIEVFISNIERLFESGEIVRVVDNNNQDVLFDGQPLKAKIVGQISQIKIDPKNRGLLYQSGDPVVVYGGLSNINGYGAVAEVGETTTGSIQSITVVNGGYGYRVEPNTTLIITDAPGANAIVASVNPNPALTGNVTFIPSDSISLKLDIDLANANYHFANAVSANINTTLADAFTFSSFPTYPISSVLVTNGGGGITKVPVVTAISSIDQDDGNKADLKSLGILAPIQIISTGLGYEVNDTIVFTGGNGLGAAANVTSVSANGEILNIEYVPSLDGVYPTGGLGYTTISLPTISVESANAQAYGAEVIVPGILGDGATFSVVTDRAGSVTTINVLDGGEDYISTPGVSLKVQDIIVYGLAADVLPQKGDIVYQGTNLLSNSYESYVDSHIQLTTDNDPLASLYLLRVYNYSSNPDPMSTLKIDPNIEMYIAAGAGDSSFTNGFKNYGDGAAKANASFLNGLVISQGQYLNTQGQPSSYTVLQNEVYNNFTYEITVDKEIAKYREVLLNLLHPSGMKILGRYAVKANGNYDLHGYQSTNHGYPLSYYTGYLDSSATMFADFTNKSNNIIQFNNLYGANLANILTANSIIQVKPINGPDIASYVESINYVDNTVTLVDYTWLTYSNVAIVTGQSGSNIINITEVVTDSYNVINHGAYSNTTYPLKDIVYAGDKVLVANNTSKTVDSVDYEAGIIYLTSNLTSNANSLMSVNRTFAAQTAVIFVTNIDTQYN
jgi:hypothetical protein